MLHHGSDQQHLTAGGNTVNHLALWNGATWTGQGGGVENEVYSLAVSGSTIFVGGAFIYYTDAVFGCQRRPGSLVKAGVRVVQDQQAGGEQQQAGDKYLAGFAVRDVQDLAVQQVFQPERADDLLAAALEGGVLRLDWGRCPGVAAGQAGSRQQVGDGGRLFAFEALL